MCYFTEEHTKKMLIVGDCVYVCDQVYKFMNITAEKNKF